MADERADQRDRIANGFSAYSASQSELGREFARRMGMHATDSAAAVEILRAEDRGQPLTPARLAERIGLTSGATSILLNRLEEAGHITRERGHADRRLVTLHSARAVHGEADDFFAPVRADLDSVMNRYATDQLALIEEFVTAFQRAIERHARPDQDRNMIQQKESGGS